jgi:hypothetical protein
MGLIAVITASNADDGAKERAPSIGATLPVLLLFEVLNPLLQQEGREVAH